MSFMAGQGQTPKKLSALDPIMPVPPTPTSTRSKIKSGQAARFASILSPQARDLASPVTART